MGADPEFFNGGGGQNARSIAIERRVGMIEYLQVQVLSSIVKF